MNDNMVVVQSPKGGVELGGVPQDAGMAIAGAAAAAEGDDGHMDLDMPDLPMSMAEEQRKFLGRG